MVAFLDAVSIQIRRTSQTRHREDWDSFQPYSEGVFQMMTITLNDPVGEQSPVFLRLITGKVPRSNPFGGRSVSAKAACGK